MEPRKDGLIICDLNVFAHSIREQIESSFSPPSTRYDTAAVARAKEDLANIRHIQETLGGNALEDELQELGTMHKPITVKAAQAALSAAKKRPSDEQRVIQAAFVWLVSGRWLGELRSQHDAIAFVGDLKCPWDEGGNRMSSGTAVAMVSSGYWRHWYLMQPEVYSLIPDKTKNARRTAKTKKPLAYMTEPLHYKAGRAFPSPALGRIRKELYRLIKLKGFPLLWSKGDEADDHAALVVRLNEQRPEADQRNITLLTTDGDWLSLIGPKVAWLCMYGHKPRMRGSMGSLNEWRAMTGVSGAIVKAKRRYGEDICADTLETPQDVVKLKMLMGDSSDALPPGSPQEVIDLRNPPKRFDLFNDYQAVVAAKDALEGCKGNLIDDELIVEQSLKFLRAQAIQRPIRELDLEDDGGSLDW